MMRNMLAGLGILFLLLLGACSNKQVKEPDFNECVPDIRISKEIVDVPPELTVINENPPIPIAGDNEALLNWSVACAANSFLYESQMRRIQQLNR